jgi:hypothetical protein
MLIFDLITGGVAWRKHHHRRLNLGGSEQGAKLTILFTGGDVLHNLQSAEW